MAVRNRGRARAAATWWGAVAYVTDLLPPRIRYGYVHRLTAAALTRPLPRVEPVVTAPPSEPLPTGPTGTDATIRCVLAADGLDIGGIGTVVEMLALGLAAHGVRPIVVCHGDGRRAARLREGGIEVRSVADEESAACAIREAGAAAIQSHSAPPFLEHAAIGSGLPLIPVMHNTEIHYTSARWRAFATLMDAAATGIAVSATVREFHLRHIGDRTPIAVIPNGAPPAPSASSAERAHARTELSRAIDVDLGDDIVFACLARYDAQKNFAGLVAGVADAIDGSDLPLRLVCAGDPSDWVEFRRADALRRAGAASERIHLLGNSDARSLLTAADAFVLDSFFEGWPVAATEAAAFGHPLLLSDVGGARELVDRDPGRSMLIPNATGDAGSVSDRRVRTARRRSRRQPNAHALREAVAVIARTIARERESGPPRIRTAAERSGIDVMLAQHADVIRTAADTHRSIP